jgi:hypothetical protein
VLGRAPPLLLLLWPPRALLLLLLDAFFCVIEVFLATVTVSGRFLQKKKVGAKQNTQQGSAAGLLKNALSGR